jgi:hypothetical protein
VELNELIDGYDTVGFVKAKRIKWLGYMEITSKERMPNRMSKGKLFSRRRKGQQHTRWLDNMLMDLVLKEDRGCRGRAEDRTDRRRVVKEDKAH